MQKMNTFISRMTAAVFVFGTLALALTAATVVRAQSPAVDPAALKILQWMTDCLGGLQKFSVHTQNTLEDLLVTGQRVDFDVAADVINLRPNKLYAERKGDLVD